MKVVKKFKDSKVRHSWLIPPPEHIPDDYNFGLIENRQRRVFTIPVGNISIEEAEATMRRLRQSYMEEVDFPEDVVINVPGYVPTVARRNGPTPMHPINNEY